MQKSVISINSDSIPLRIIHSTKRYTKGDKRHVRRTNYWGSLTVFYVMTVDPTSFIEASKYSLQAWLLWGELLMQKIDLQ